MKAAQLLLLAAAAALLAVPVLSARSLQVFEDTPLDDLDIDFVPCYDGVLTQCCGRFNATADGHFPKCEVTNETNKTVTIREGEVKKFGFDAANHGKKELPPRTETTVTTVEKEEWVLVKDKNGAETWKFVGAVLFCVCPVS